MRSHTGKPREAQRGGIPRRVDLAPAMVAVVSASITLLAACMSGGGEVPAASTSSAAPPVATGRGDGGADADADADADAKSPPQAAAAGYDVHTFSSTFAKATVDLNDAKTSGFAWYLGQFFGDADTPASDLTFNADGTLTLDGAGTVDNAGIDTAAPSTSNSAGWVGVAFGGGGYFEAVFAFDPKDTIAANDAGWPSWWAMSIEHLASLPDEQWPGQATGYAHFIETDFFEYDVWSFSPHNEYGGAMHDWWGLWQSTCASGYCNVSNSGGAGTSFSNFQVETPSSTDFTQYRRQRANDAEVRRCLADVGGGELDGVTASRGVRRHPTIVSRSISSAPLDRVVLPDAVGSALRRRGGTSSVPTGCRSMRGSARLGAGLA